VPHLSADIPASLKAALDRKADQSELSTSAVVIAALARYLSTRFTPCFRSRRRAPSSPAFMIAR